MRMFLTRYGMEYYNLAQAALEGNYYERGADFFNGQKGFTTRLRAEVHRVNGSFTAHMREKASKRKLVESDESEDESASETEPLSEHDPLLVKKKQLDLWIRELCLQSPRLARSNSGRPISALVAGNSLAAITIFSLQSYFTRTLVDGQISPINTTGQRSLSGESSAPPPNSSGSNAAPTISMNHATTNGNVNTNEGDGMGSDADADAYANMEEDDSFVEMSDAPQQQQARARKAPMAGSTNFRLANGNVNAGGNGQQGRGMEGIENQVV